MSIFSRQRKQPSADYVSPAAADAFMFGQTGNAAFLPAGWRGPKDERDVSLAATDEEYWASRYPSGQLDREIAEAYMLGVASRTSTPAELARPAADGASTPVPSSGEPPSPISQDEGNLKAWVLADWCVRDFAPVWLAALGPDDPAVILRATPELKSLADLPEAQRRIDKVGAMMNGVSEAVGGTPAERDLAADITTSCIGGLTDYTNLVTAQGGEALGSIAYQALRLAGIAGTNYLVAGIHSAPPRFRNDAAALRAALRQALQPTVDASNASIHVLGERLAAADEEEPTAPTPATESLGDGVERIETAGRTYDEVIADVQGALTGDFQQDGAFITAVAQSCGDHPQAKEIRRELGRMLSAIAPDDVKAKFDEITAGYEDGFEPGLAEARAQMRGGKFTEARGLLEDLIDRYGARTGLFLDDSVSEYRHFANDFEAALYVHLYPSEKHLRKLPQDRAALYTDYGAVLLELRDTDGAEQALREALKVNPVSTDAMFELGEVMKLTGRKREFRELTLRAMSVAYSLAALARAYRNLGYLAVEEEDFDIAVACYGMSLAIDRDRAQAAQSELFYIQQVTGRALHLPDRPTIDATLARSGIQVGPSPLVRQLMDSAA